MNSTTRVLAPSERLIWCDIENFGLDDSDPILEIGFQITTLDLETVDEVSFLVWENEYPQFYKNCEELVRRMHTKNKLFEEAEASGEVREEVCKKIITWMKEHRLEGADPLCGSSVGFDKGILRSQMPAVLDMFHYRVIDNSSTKELCRRYNPEVYKALPSKNEEHRVMPDLDDTIREFRFYRDEFLLW